MLFVFGDLNCLVLFAITFYLLESFLTICKRIDFLLNVNFPKTDSEIELSNSGLKSCSGGKPVMGNVFKNIQRSLISRIKYPQKALCLIYKLYWKFPDCILLKHSRNISHQHKMSIIQPNANILRSIFFCKQL